MFCGLIFVGVLALLAVSDAGTLPQLKATKDIVMDTVDRVERSSYYKQKIDFR